MGRALAALFAFLLTAAGPQQDVGTIVVRVVRPDNSQPLAGVQVSLTRSVSALIPRTESPEESRLATTDGGGVAVFSDLEDGLYTATVDPDGYFGVGGQEPARGASVSRALGAGQTRHEIALLLVPRASVSGRVLAADGSPLPDVEVAPFRVIYPDGLPVLERLRVGRAAGLAVADLRRLLPEDITARTDASGRYEFPDLPPGAYYIRADLGAPESASGARVDGLAGLAYYPGVASASQARPLPVRPGDVLTGVDIAVYSGTGRQISGTLSTVSPGMFPPEGCSVYGYYLVPRDAFLAVEEPARLRGAGSRSCELDEGVAFELENVPPGRYDLHAVVGDVETLRSPTGPTYYSGRAPIEVSDEDVSGVVVQIRRGATLSGQVVLEEAAGAAPPAFERVDLSLVPTEILPEPARPRRASGLQQRVDASGRFVVENVPQGQYRLVLEGGLPPGAYLADVLQGAASLYTNPTIWFDTADPIPVEIVLARDGGAIRGSVRSGTLPADTASVVLVPEPAYRENFSLYRVIRISRGEFSFRDLAPGRYTVFALESLPEGAEWNREFMARYEGRGSPVTVEGGEAVVLDLQTLPALP